MGDKEGGVKSKNLKNGVMSFMDGPYIFSGRPIEKNVRWFRLL